MIRVGTRGSPLARRQAERVRARLTALGLASTLVVVHSSGDASQDAPVASLGTGIFTRELEAALLDGRIDAAVHSLKDLPSRTAPGLALAAIPEREDARDAVAGRPLATLAPGARVGSSSPRRQEWLSRRFPTLQALPVRGNVDTRLRKLENGDYDALLMALAGLRRLGLDSRVAETLPLDDLLPPAGQGALAVETRTAEAGLLGAIDDPSLRKAVECERALLAFLRAGCRTPLGAYAETAGDRVRLRADLAGLRAEAEGPDGERVAREAGERLLAMGAEEHLRKWG